MTPESRKHLADSLALFLQGGKTGEQGARELFDALWHIFVADFKRAGLPTGVAEEVASDAFFKLLNAAVDLREPVALEAWAMRIARNTLYTHFRDTKQESVHEVYADDDEWSLLHNHVADLGTGDPTTMICLQGQLEKFCREHPDRSWTLGQCVLEGLSLEEMSLQLNRTLAATKEYLSQCRKHLRRYLEPCLE